MVSDDLADLRVLLVDADLFFAARLLAGLAKIGCTFERVANPDDAVRRIAEIDPDVVIINLGTPRIGGIETVRRLKSEGHARRVLAFLSHVHIPSVREAALAAGVDRLCANSAITMRLPDILREVVSDRPNSEETEIAPIQEGE